LKKYTLQDEFDKVANVYEIIASSDEITHLMVLPRRVLCYMTKGQTWSQVSDTRYRGSLKRLWK